MFIQKIKGKGALLTLNSAGWNYNIYLIRGRRDSLPADTAPGAYDVIPGRARAKSGRKEAAALNAYDPWEHILGLTAAEERNRIAAEMHDTVGHTLTAAVLTLEAAQGLVSEQPSEAALKLLQGKEQVQRGLSELRASVKAVREEGKTEFCAALGQLLQEILSDTGLAVHSIVDLPLHVPPLQAGILLAAVKECATNAIKHGHASQADILIQEHKGQLRLTFTDDGIGSTGARPGSGLSILRERVWSVGGMLEIESAPGEGFTVSLAVPIEQREGDVLCSRSPFYWPTIRPSSGTAFARFSQLFRISK